MNFTVAYNVKSVFYRLNSALGLSGERNWSADRRLTRNCDCCYLKINNGNPVDLNRRRGAFNRCCLILCRCRIRVGDYTVVVFCAFGSCRGIICRACCAVNSRTAVI